MPSPSPDTHAGREFLRENLDHPGSLGIAISEAIEDAVTSQNAKYSLGSVLNHVLMHQTIIDLASYDAYLSGKLHDYVMPDEDIEQLVCNLKRC